MNVLVVCAHPDDEVLGCGATISKYTSSGNNVYVLTLADGEQSRKGSQVKDRQSLLSKSCDLLRCKGYKALNLKDNKLDTYSLLEIVQLIESYIADVNPDVVLTHSLSDLNIDHRVTHKAVMTACRGLPSSKIKKILAFETPSSTEWQSVESASFIPDYFVDITDQYHKKEEALNIYLTEMREFPHPRSFEYIDSLSKIRGAAVGVERAEAFKVLRIID